MTQTLTAAATGTRYVVKTEIPAYSRAWSTEESALADARSRSKTSRDSRATVERKTTGDLNTTRVVVENGAITRTVMGRTRGTHRWANLDCQTQTTAWGVGDLVFSHTPWTGTREAEMARVQAWIDGAPWN